MALLNQFYRQGLIALLGIIPMASTVFLSLSALADYKQTNLVTDDQKVTPAKYTDRNLVNPWGIDIDLTTNDFWIVNAGRAATGTLNGVPGTGTAYDAKGKPLQVVNITSTLDGSGPAGIIYNSTKDFDGYSFISGNLDGSISAWNRSDKTAKTVYKSTGSVYSGLAIGSYNGSNYLYAANFQNKKIDVLDKTFRPVTLPNKFVDPNLPATYTPFNIQEIGGQLYVAYAVLTNDPDNQPTGSGYVDIFDTSGKFVKRLISGGKLNSPWGLALAPEEFGEFGQALLVGNFSENDGTINAYDRNTGKYLGTLKDTKGNPIKNSDLWGLIFGKGANRNVLYFTAGIGGQTHGLFGKISDSDKNDDE